MNSILAAPYVPTLAWTLVHFLWQGAVIGLLAALLFKRVLTPASRYFTGVVTC